MKKTGLILSLLGASVLGAFATTPASAAEKPCCYNNGEYFESTPSTCARYGGRTVSQRYCGGYRYDNRYDRSGPSFAIQLGNVVFAYEDGYYDSSRRWHSWRSNDERNWYRNNYRSRYYNYRRDRDRDQRRRDWWEGRRDRWN